MCERVRPPAPVGGRSAVASRGDWWRAALVPAAAGPPRGCMNGPETPASFEAKPDRRAPIWNSRSRGRPQRDRRRAHTTRWRPRGRNRASIGVQDFDPEIQKIIGRIQTYDGDPKRGRGVARRRHPFAERRHSCSGCRPRARIRIADSVQMLLSLVPDRVALYGYAHVPLMAKRQAMIPTDALPTPDSVAPVETSRWLFLWDQYQEIGIDHFAKPDGQHGPSRRAPGHLRRNFQGYTRRHLRGADRPWRLGDLAVSARLPPNASATAAYQKHSARASLPPAAAILQGAGPLRSRMIEMLMCEFRMTPPSCCAISTCRRPS